jgi:hypothetical protein
LVEPLSSKVANMANIVIPQISMHRSHVELPNKEKMSRFFLPEAGIEIVG